MADASLSRVKLVTTLRLRNANQCVTSFANAPLERTVANCAFCTVRTVLVLVLVCTLGRWWQRGPPFPLFWTQLSSAQLRLVYLII